MREKLEDGFYYHWNWLMQRFYQNEYLRERFVVRQINQKEYGFCDFKNNTIFIVKRTSENCFQVALLSDYQTDFKSFKRALGVLRFMKNYSECIDMLNAYKQVGVTFNLSNFRWNLLGFTELVKGVRLNVRTECKSKKQTSSDAFEDFRKECYYNSRFSRKHW